ncbi:MAG TPA: type II toxin-antitoxin system VapC family toxin [Thermoanaerobaculia bacterium]|nr:type II toxin-antitoxin system VapC family toxin [Thermoanaerobaculia bacterium]
MNAGSEQLLLDTNVVVHLFRGKATGESIDRAFAIRTRRERPLLSVVSVGELHSLARGWGWGEKKIEALRTLISELVVVDIQRAPILDRYAEIDAFCKANGFQLGNNDTWIAATAAATGALLLTCDKDFDPLDGRFLRRHLVAPLPSRPTP